MDTPSTTVDDVYMKQKTMLFRNVGRDVAASNAGKMKEVGVLNLMLIFIHKKERCSIIHTDLLPIL